MLANLTIGIVIIVLIIETVILFRLSERVSMLKSAIERGAMASERLEEQGLSYPPKKTRIRPIRLREIEELTNLTRYECPECSRQFISNPLNNSELVCPWCKAGK